MFLPQVYIRQLQNEISHLRKQLKRSIDQCKELEQNVKKKRKISTIAVNLPPELFTIIGSYIYKVRDIIRLTLVCKHFRDSILNNQMLWYIRCKFENFTDTPEFELAPTSWLNIFKERYICLKNWKNGKFEEEVLIEPNLRKREKITCFSALGSLLVTGTSLGCVTLWRSIKSQNENSTALFLYNYKVTPASINSSYEYINKLELMRFLQRNTKITTIKLLNEGRLLAVVDDNNCLTIWDIVGLWDKQEKKKGSFLLAKLLFQSRGFGNLDSSEIVTPAGEHCILGVHCNRVSLLNLNTGALVYYEAQSWMEDLRCPVSCYSIRGNQLAIGTTFGTICLYNDIFNMKKVVNGVFHPDDVIHAIYDNSHTGIRAIQIVPDKFIITGTSIGLIFIWDPITKKKIQQLDDHTSPVERLYFMNHSNQFISIGKDRQIIVYELDPSTKLFFAQYSLPYTNSMNHVHYDGKRFLTTAGKYEIQVFDVNEGKSIQVFNQHSIYLCSPITAMHATMEHLVVSAGNLIHFVNFSNERQLNEATTQFSSAVSVICNKESEL